MGGCQALLEPLRASKRNQLVAVASRSQAMGAGHYDLEGPTGQVHRTGHPDMLNACCAGDFAHDRNVAPEQLHRNGSM